MDDTAIPDDLTVGHPAGIGAIIEGGVKVSISQQRRAMELAGIDYVEAPSADYDILHSNYIGIIPFIHLMRAKRAGKIVVMHAHSTGEDLRHTFLFSRLTVPVIRRYLRYQYQRADRVLAVSEFMEEELRRLGVTSDIRVVTNGIDTEALDAVADRREATQERDGLTVLNLSRVYPYKGIDSFVRTGAAFEDVQFTWYGPKHQYLLPPRTQWQLHRLPGNVQFPGFIDDKLAALAEGDIFFSPSTYETQGISALEAAYCGMPVVLRDLPVYDPVWTHGENCLKADDVAGFREHIERLQADPDLRQRLGEQAHDTAAEHDLDSVAEQLSGAYASLLKTRGEG